MNKLTFRVLREANLNRAPQIGIRSVRQTLSQAHCDSLKLS